MSTRHWAGAYFFMQGTAIVLWWLLLLFFPSTREYFLLGGGSEDTLRAFLLPDLVTLVFSSFVACILCFRDGSGVQAGVWFTSGAISYVTLYCLALAVITGVGWLGVTLMLPAMLLSITSALAVSPFVSEFFRQAAPASSGWNLAKTVIQIIIFWGVLLFLIPYLITEMEESIGVLHFRFTFQRALSFLLFFCFSALGLWSGLTMAHAGEGTPLPLDSPRRLVISGPYAYVRNPMAIAGLGQGIAVGLWLGSALVLGYVFIGGCIWQLFVRPLEEDDMMKHFGAAYSNYALHVACWRPGLKRYEPNRLGHQ